MKLMQMPFLRSDIPVLQHGDLCWPAVCPIAEGSLLTPRATVRYWSCRGAAAYLIYFVHPHPTAVAAAAVRQLPALHHARSHLSAHQPLTGEHGRGNVSTGQPPTHVSVAGEDGGPPVALRRQLRPLVL
jgi:hypothetical protein